ncbi:MAG: tetratricopeptide repeat protein [Bacteroidales bacterium]
MKIRLLIQVLIFAILLQSCKSSSFVSKISEEAEIAYKAGDYEKALAVCEKEITEKEAKGKRAIGPVYVGAGKASLELNQIDKARKYLETARSLSYSSPDMYESLAQVYQSIDNLSKEITALENYKKFYPQGEKTTTINIRLFETYIESENWELANKLWPEIEPQAQNEVKLLSGYLLVNKKLENNAGCDKLAQQVLKLDASNITALEWYAEKYYWKAENLYLSEMKAYKAKRTNSQYSRLLKALEQVYPDFRKSRDYYLKLYKIDPKKEYANFLGNIFTRLDDKTKAEYYYKKAK